MKIEFIERFFNKEKQQNPVVSLTWDFHQSYPRVTLSNAFNKQAYNLLFLIKIEYLTQLKSILQSQCPEVSVEVYRKTQEKKGSDSSIFQLNLLDDFGGFVVHLITNDHSIVDAILDAHLSPPEPMISFPDINPDEYGSLQGDIDFWFTWLWTPYWEFLTQDERAKLKLTSSWREFIEFRTEQV
ncbi:hypothetical protein P0Y67_11810 [Photobacterium sp. SP02]|uniref:hypothetical protein n=1 Tax=Photobacterium sp. SP02 TaxID=3032280 RepID=UPI0031450184